MAKVIGAVVTGNLNPCWLPKAATVCHSCYKLSTMTQINSSPSPIRQYPIFDNKLGRYSSCSSMPKVVWAGVVRRLCTKCRHLICVPVCGLVPGTHADKTYSDRLVLEPADMLSAVFYLVCIEAHYLKFVCTLPCAHHARSCRAR